VIDSLTVAFASSLAALAGSVFGMAVVWFVLDFFIRLCEGSEDQ